MKRWFSALPIHRKLTALALAVSATSLLAAVIALALFDVARFRGAAVGDARTFAQLIAENTAAAIVFDDPEAARATLSSVAARQNIIRACVYREDGSLLASFTREGRRDCSTDIDGTTTWGLIVSRVPVLRNGRQVGAVVVERDLSDLGARVIATATTGLVVLLIGGLTALGLARALQRIVSRPIVELARAARTVGRDQQFELPPIEAPPDETGDLVRAFGEMVRRVGESNTALLESNDALRREVEQRRQMEVEREALLAREREASRLKDEFLAAVSHELRTPLNAILGWTQILQSTRPSEETMQRAIASLARNGQAQSRVIEDLLDISRIITGKLQLSMASLDLRDVVDASVDVVEPLANSRGISLVYELPPDPCMVQGDSDRLRQVLWNLLSNSLKFTPRGGRVTVQLVCDAANVSIIVSDTGAGIAPSFLSHAFERFRQADGSTTREQGGLGLGLAIVKELTELHGGSVRAESAGVGKGARFTVRLPRAQAPQPGEQVDVPAFGPTPSLAGMRVMVVDDNRDALDLLGHALMQAGAEVWLEPSGPAAVARWEQESADVLVCDLAMPGIDGFEVLRRIRAIDARAGRATHALAVTAYASEDYRVRCLQAGFVGHLSKPYRIVDVIRAVAAAAQRTVP